MRSTVVVVTWRGRSRLTACLTALAAQDRPHRTVVIDNASTDGTARLLTELPADAVVRLATNTGYAGGLAAALEDVDTEFLVWLNDDAVPEPGWLAALEDAAAADVGAVSGRLGSALGTRLTRDGYGYDVEDAPIFGFGGGGCLLRTEALREVGGVPAEFFCYYEDTDTAWRLRLAGWRIVTAPEAVAAHALGASTNPGSPPFHRWNERNRLLMLLRCAPLSVAIVQWLKFLALTGKFAIRPGSAANHRLATRLHVLADALRLLPRTLRARRRVSCVVEREVVWSAWAGRPGV